MCCFISIEAVRGWLEEEAVEQQVAFDVTIRNERGKGEARRLRLKGLVPAILYGLDADPVAISMDTKEMTRILKSPSGHNQILNITMDGMETTAAMAADWQVDPLHGYLLHVDMKRVDLTKKVTVRVAISTQGVAVGVKDEGGLEEIVSREIEINCLPLEVPAAIEVDVTPLAIGDAIRVRDLPPSDVYECITPPERVVVHVVAPKVEVEEETEEAEGEEGEAAEPEVAEKGKIEEKE